MKKTIPPDLKKRFYDQLGPDIIRFLKEPTYDDTFEKKGQGKPLLFYIDEFLDVAYAHGYRDGLLDSNDSKPKNE